MTSVTAQSHAWMMVIMVSGLASSFSFASSQWFPTFSDHVPFVGPIVSARTTLFQEK